MLTIIGCGNSNRSDDGAGVFVAQALQRRLHEAPHNDVRVFDAGTGGMEVMFQARGASRLVIVDAARSGAAPGAVFEVPGEQLEAEREPSLNLHDFRWDHALSAGRRIFREQFPSDVTVLLIEAQTLALGLDLSAPVRAAAEQVVERLWHQIEAVPRALPAARVARGSVYLAREVCAAHLGRSESVALLERGGEIVVVPLRAESGGGLLLKQRNARGDRVIDAQEFFRVQGFDESFSAEVAVRWDEAHAALVLSGVPRRAA